ncbi:MAG: hypothetical protein AAF680_07265 [Pseudomonadota bacterium]
MELLETRQRSVSDFPSFLLGLGALALVFAVLILGLYFYASLGTGAKTIDLSAAQGEPGLSSVTKNSLSFRLDTSGQARIVVPVEVLSIDRLTWLTFQARTGDPTMRLSFYQKVAGISAVIPLAAVQLEGETQRVFLGNSAHFGPGIDELHLTVEGRARSPLTLANVRLEPAKPAFILVELSKALGLAEGWSGFSINAFVSPATKYLQPLTAFSTAFIVGVFILLVVPMVLLLRFFPVLSTRSLSAAAVAFVLLWMLLDAHWARQLWFNMSNARSLYAGKNEEERLLASEHAVFHKLAERVRRELQEYPDTRVFIAGSNDYAGMRINYHLYPLNVYWRRHRELPDPENFRSGDHVLVMNPTKHRYEDDRIAYPDGRQSSNAEVVFVSKNAALLRLQ